MPDSRLGLSSAPGVATPRDEAHALANAEVWCLGSTELVPANLEDVNLSGLERLLGGDGRIEKLCKSKTKDRKYKHVTKSVKRPKRLAADTLASRDPWRD